MILDSRITVATPILNEAFFLQGWLKCVAEIADQVVVTDGGSTDNSVKQLLKFSEDHPEIDVDLKYAPQEGKPYSDDWNEGVVRNDLIERSNGDFIVLLDADELITWADLRMVIGLMNDNIPELANRANIKHVPFWGDFRHVRLNTKEDPRWFGGDVARIIRNNKTCKYNEAKHHCGLGGEPVIVTEGKLFHCHYAFGTKQLKEGDCRLYDFSDKPILKPLIGPYEGPYPEGLWGMYPELPK